MRNAAILQECGAWVSAALPSSRSAEPGFAVQCAAMITAASTINQVRE